MLNQRSWALAALLTLLSISSLAAAPPDAALRGEAGAALRRAADYFRQRVARHGGYVYHYSLDLQRRWGEGVATPDQIWVQPPGTPTVGIALLAAYDATREPAYLEGAVAAARALIYGQLESGAWTNSIDFDPKSKNVAQYRGGRGRGRNYSTLDDGISQSAIRFLALVDRATGFHDAEIHEAARVAVDALLRAQFPNGAFPQVWTGPSSKQPIRRAQYPDYDWRTENRVKEYWNFYTLNDDVCGYVAATLQTAAEVYDDKRCTEALIKLGDFLVLAQMPDPQPAWAQQYDYDMHPVWARRFEPPAVSGRESQDAIRVLMKVYELTGDEKYLEPIPRALAYLKSSLLSDGRLARYYELRSNRPLYMTEKYELTYDDGRVPDHYGWKTDSEVEPLSQALARIRQRSPRTTETVSEATVRELIDQLDDEGRWISTYEGGMLIGQPKFRRGDQYLSSAVFSRNVETLSRYLRQ
ncbi:MAG: pectate lyase [Pirellulaceae bacterium]